MSYEKDPWIVSVVWGRIGAALLALIAFILGIYGYTVSPEDTATVYDLVAAIFAGCAGLWAIISKIRETKKAE